MLIVVMSSTYQCRSCMVVGMMQMLMVVKLLFFFSFLVVMLMFCFGVALGDVCQCAGDGV